MSLFNKIPFLRILIPFVSGVLFQLSVIIEGKYFYLLFLLLPLAMWPAFFKKQNPVKRLFLILCVDVFLFLLATELTKSSQIINQQDYFGKKIENDSIHCIARICDIPVQKPKTKKVLLNVEKVAVKGEYIHTIGKLVAYFQNSVYTSNLTSGSYVMVKAPLNEMKAPANPDMFDFKRFFNDKGIYYTCYVDSVSFVQIPVESAGFSLWYFGLAVKEKMINRLKTVGLSDNAYALCAALITGYDADLDRNITDSFAASGTMHILSVSGLHVGLIYMILAYTVGIFDKKNKYKLLQLLLISIFLWFFALLTGFSAPVLRAVIMFNLFGFGRLFFRNKISNQLNILCVAAFLLLFINPFYIRDIGFILSFSALFGILYFYPRLEAIYLPENTVLKYFYSAALVSISATISTLPVTLFVFHQFPLWFIPANLLVVPLAFVLLILAFASLFNLVFISWLANQLSTLLVWLIHFFTGNINGIDFNFTDALLLTLFLYLVNYVFLKRQYRYVIWCMVTIIVWQIISFFSAIKNKDISELVIFQIPKHTAISVKNKTETTLFYTDSLSFKSNVQPHITTYNYSQINFNSFNYFQNKHFNMLVIYDKNKIPSSSNILNTVVICNNAIPTKPFFKKHIINRLIADGSNNFYSLVKLENICATFGIEFYSTQTKGAFIKRFN